MLRRSGSVTRWIGEFKAGDEEAVAALWDCFERRMLRLARNKLNDRVRCVYDEEDVALSAFGTLYESMRDGRYDGVSNRTELWRLLTVFILNKARDRNLHENRLCRGGDRAKFELDEVIGKLQSDSCRPDDLMAMQEDCQTLLATLQRPEVQAVALLKLDGFTNEQIGQHLNCTRRAVQRRLALIRDLWVDRVAGSISASNEPVDERIARKQAQSASRVP